MKVALAQLDVIIGDLENNATRIIETIDRAKSEGADLIVFSELCICGYIPKDMLNYNSFIERSDKVVEELAKSAVGIGVIIGAPRFSNLDDGKRLYNAALFLHEGKVIQEFYKSLLPTYDIFDEYRYFEPARTHDTITITYSVSCTFNIL